MTPFDYKDKKDSVITEIQKDNGLKMPCLFALLNQSRLLYLRSQKMSQRVETLESESKEDHRWTFKNLFKRASNVRNS